jgi:hypothetical protein
LIFHQKPSKLYDNYNGLNLINFIKYQNVSHTKIIQTRWW